MSVGFFLPHVPLFATQKWFDLYPNDDTVLPKIKRNDREDTPRFSWYMHWYLPEVRQKWLEDNKSGGTSPAAIWPAPPSWTHRWAAFAALKKNGLEENTIIVLWSDHGWHVGEKGISAKTHCGMMALACPWFLPGRA